MTGKDIVNHISKYLFHKFNGSRTMSVRYSRDHRSFYVYNNTAGRPFCVATIRISDHDPVLYNLINMDKTDYRIAAKTNPKETRIPNISVEFYDKRSIPTPTKNIKSPYAFNILRYCYQTDKLTMDDIKKLMIEIIYFIENNEYKFEDPFKGTYKKAKIYPGKGYKANIPMRLPKEAELKFGKNLNFWQVYNPFESTDNHFTYMFTTFNNKINIIETVNNFINIEIEKNTLYENIMNSISRSRTLS